MKYIFAALILSTVFSLNVSGASDWRKLENGTSIYQNGYIDQPYVVVLDDNSWLCVFTTGIGHEGSGGQHVASTRSFDQGRTWSAPVQIESPSGPEASWGMPYKTTYGRIYVFYTYNGDNITHLKGARIRADMLGWYCFKYSDDNGETWSQRYRLPLRLTSVDLNNDFNGQVQMFWGIGKPITYENTVYFSFTKIGKYLIDSGEGWVFKCQNLNNEKNPNKLNWVMLPEGDKGFRLPYQASVQEEHNLVPMNNGDLYCLFRTTQGYPGHLYGKLNGSYWTTPKLATYNPLNSRLIKNPRACPRVWKCANGKYLMWFHNHSGDNFYGRNPVWLSGGIEKDGEIYWSEPAILFYSPDTSYKTGRISYPDIIEQNGQYWITETQKYVARTHEIDPSLLQGLWNQAYANSLTMAGLLYNLNDSFIKSNRNVNVTMLPSLKTGGFSIELWFKLTNLGSGQVLLNSKNASGAGIRVLTTVSNSLQIELNDGINAPQFLSANLSILKVNQEHHVVFIVDGASDVMTIVFDGQLCDGGTQLTKGWTFFSPFIENVQGSGIMTLGPSMNGVILNFKLYDRYLRTSEAISNYRYNFGRRGLSPKIPYHFSYTDVVIPLSPVGVEINDENRDIVEVFPNPATSEIHVAFTPGKSGEIELRLLDMNGKVLLSQAESVFQELTSNTILQVGDLKEGMYILELKQGTVFLKQKVIIAR